MPRSGRIVLWIGIGMVVLALGAGIALWISVRGAKQRVAERKAEMVALGEPVTFAEIVPPPIPDAENAAVPLREAFRILEAAESDYEVEERLREELVAEPWDADDEVLEIARTWLRERAGVEAHVEQALARPRCRFEENWISIVEQMREQDVEEEVDALPPAEDGNLHAGFRELLLWWEVQAALAARAGRGEDALDRIEEALRLTPRAHGGDLFFSFLSRRAAIPGILTSLQTIMRRCPVSEARRERLLGILESLEDPAGFRRAIVSERAQGLEMYGHLDALGERPDGSWTSDLFFSHDTEYFLELCERSLALAEQPYHQSRDAWEGLESRLEEGPWWAVLSRMIVVMHPLVAEKDANCRAALRLARLGLAFDAARRDDGTLPDALCETVDAVDPFDGQPIRCRGTADGGYVLSSVEEDADLVWRVAGKVPR